VAEDVDDRGEEHVRGLRSGLLADGRADAFLELATWHRWHALFELAHVAIAHRYGYPVERAANTLVVASKKEPKKYAACVVLATTRLDVNHAVRDLLGVTKVSFASPEEMNALTGMRVGGVTAFGLPEGLPLYVDSRVLDLDWIILGTGGRNGKVRIGPDVFHRIPGVKVVEGLAVPLPPRS